MRLLKIFLLFICFLWSVQAFGAGDSPVMFIANKSVVVDSMDQAKVKKIYKGKVLEWGDGNRIKVILYMEDPAHKAFCKFYLKISPVQLKNTWRKLTFTGKVVGDQLKRFDSPEELIQLIDQNKHTIGFLPADYKGNLPENVKIIKIEEVQ